jgi:hypothetical protein
MSPRGDEKSDLSATCRDTMLDLLLAGQLPSERQVETLLDRLEPRGSPEAEA